MPRARSTPRPTAHQSRLIFDEPDRVEREVAGAANNLPRPTIAQILRVAWPHAIEHLRHPQYGFYDPELNQYARRGLIEISDFTWTDDTTTVSVFLCWHRRDDLQLSTIHQKVTFVTALIENALASHDHFLLQRLRTAAHRADFHRAIVTPRYAYVLGAIDPVVTSHAFTATVESAVRFV